MKYRTWSMPLVEIPQVRGLIRVPIPNHETGKPEWTAQATANAFEESSYEQSDYCVLLQRAFGGRNLRFPSLVEEGQLLFPEATMFWRNWFEKYIAEMDRLDQTPAAFFFDFEMPWNEALQVMPWYGEHVYSQLREKWQGIRLGNWMEANYTEHPIRGGGSGVRDTNWTRNQLQMLIDAGLIEDADSWPDLLQGTEQCPVLYYGTPESNADFLSCVKTDHPIVPWIATPESDSRWGFSRDEPHFAKIQAVLHKAGINECLAWGVLQDDEAWWERFAKTVEWIEALRTP